MQDLIFSEPIWLYSGIVLAVASGFAFRLFDKKNHRDLKKFAAGSLLEKYQTGVSPLRRWIKRVCFSLGVLLLFSALARPQLGFEWKEVKRKGIDILFAIDSSRSMLAEDMSPNRLERTKLGMMDFVDKLEGDRIGLLPFAGNSFLLCPLTLDYNAFKRSLDAVDTDIIPHKGTDIASAIREAARIFEKAGHNHRILVILTDGEDLQGEALEAAKEAAEQNLVIYTVGIGSSEGEFIPIGGSLLQDQSGNPVRSKLDESGLKSIAEVARGSYAQFGQLGEGLEKIYQEKLSLIPKQDLKQRMQKVPIERYQIPLGVAILLFLLEFVLPDRRRSVKNDASEVKISPVMNTAVMVAIFFALQPKISNAQTASENYNSGIESFSGKDMEAAHVSFKGAIMNTSDLELQAKSYYNLGNTQFNIGAQKLSKKDAEGALADWEKSLVAYESSLKLYPDDADAEHNRDYVKKKIEELKKQQEKQQKQEDQNDQKNDEKEQKEDKKDQKGKQDKKSDKKDQSDDQKSDKKESADLSDKSEQDKKQEGKEDGEDTGKPDEGKKDDSEKSDQKGERADKKEGEQTQQDGTENPSDKSDTEDEKEQTKPSENGKSANEAEKKQQGEDQSANAAQQGQRKTGEMSKEEAQQLLKALEQNEEQVLLVPQSEGKRGQNFRENNTTKGKDW